MSNSKIISLSRKLSIRFEIFSANLFFYIKTYTKLRYKAVRLELSLPTIQINHKQWNISSSAEPILVPVFGRNCTESGY